MMNSKNRLTASGDVPGLEARQMLAAALSSPVQEIDVLVNQGSNDLFSMSTSSGVGGETKSSDPFESFELSGVDIVDGKITIEVRNDTRDKFVGTFKVGKQALASGLKVINLSNAYANGTLKVVGDLYGQGSRA